MKNSFFELIDQRLTRIPLLGRIMDERFVNYRLRATRAGAIASAIVGIGLFEYRYFVNHIWSWDLLAVVGTMVVVKLGMVMRYLIAE